MKKVTIWLIHLYQRTISPDSGLPHKIGLTRNVCGMYPKCSDYTILAVQKYGVCKGLWFGFRRVLRCHPWQKKRIDDLP